MSVTRIFSIYDESGEKAIVTLTGATVEDMRDRSTLLVLDEQGETVSRTVYHSNLKVREIK